MTRNILYSLIFAILAVALINFGWSLFWNGKTVLGHSELTIARLLGITVVIVTAYVAMAEIDREPKVPASYKGLVCLIMVAIAAMLIGEIGVPDPRHPPIAPPTGVPA